MFLLGPSHHFYLNNCALSKFEYYQTPLGDLRLDQEIMTELHKTGKFGFMNRGTDEDEHSLELHLPYIFKILSIQFERPEDFPTLVPILVGNTSSNSEKEFGAILAPYLKDPTNVFVISSDFAHWGLRFQYTYYLMDLANESTGTHLRAADRLPTDKPKIYESIERVDKVTMDCIRGGSHNSLLQILRTTGNTVCGRHPIGVIMAAKEILEKEMVLDKAESKFEFIRYARSSDCLEIFDSSVSYVSGFAVVKCQVADESVAEAEDS